MEKKGEDRDLTEEGVTRGSLGGSALNTIHYEAKSKNKVVKKGDCNFRYYHMTVNWK